MHLGLALPFGDIGGDGATVREFAELAEAEGYHGLTLADHVLGGNPAQKQLQLGNFGDVFDMTAKYVADGNGLIPSQRQQLTELADYLRHVWDRDDASIWELGDRRPVTLGRGNHASGADYRLSDKPADPLGADPLELALDRLH